MERNDERPLGAVLEQNAVVEVEGTVILPVGRRKTPGERKGERKERRMPW